LPGKSSVPNEVKGNVADGRRGEFKLSGPSVLFLAVVREKAGKRRYLSSIIKVSPERISIAVTKITIREQMCRGSV